MGCQSLGVQHPGELFRLLRGVVDPCEEGVLKGDASPRGDEILLAVVQEVVEGIRLRRGMRRSRSSWFGACSDTARVLCSLAPASRSIAPRTPTVDMVMWRAPIPTSALSASCARSTLGTLSSGSPIPMNTTLVTRVPKCSSSETTWSTISCGARLRAKPPYPWRRTCIASGNPPARRRTR